MTEHNGPVRAFMDRHFLHFNSREVVAAKALTANDLEGIRTIRVRGVRNQRATS